MQLKIFVILLTTVLKNLDLGTLHFPYIAPQTLTHT